MDRPLTANVDRTLLTLVAILALLGLYNLSSASKPLGISLHVNHAIYLVVGFAVMALVAAVPYRNLEGLAIPILVVCVLLLLATSGFGKLVNGSRRWLVIGPINIQTSDLAKLAVIVVVARTFHLERWEDGMTLKSLLRPLNLSRPLLLLGVVIALSLFGDTLRPAKLQVEKRASTAQGRSRFVSVARLRPGEAPKTIGRAPGEGGVVFRRSGVADQHATVTRVGAGEYRLEDLGSDSGTFVNEQRLEAPVLLSHDDTIRFGTNQQATLRFQAPTQQLRPFLPLLALIGALWLILAFYVQTNQGGWEEQHLIAPVDVVAIPALLILIQPDLGTTLVVLLIAFTMILYVGLRLLSLVFLTGASLFFGFFAWFAVLKPYQQERILTFLNPQSDLSGAGYHQHQSLIAVGSGQMWGKGYGQGTQTQLSFLPEAWTDFIFSVWAEEHGFMGCLVVVGLFAALILYGFRIAARARDRFGALLAVGATAMIFWHTVVNMLMVLRLAPVVGVPLPLWSNGGSFLLTTMVAIGLLLNVSMRRHFF